MYERREKRGQEAGEKRKNYATLRNISQSKKCKGAGAKLNTGREPGLKGTGSGRFKPPCPPSPPTKKSHFIFDGQYYDHIDGVFMGSPLRPVWANIFICHFEEKWVMNGRVCPGLWYRYVDDTFTMFDSKDTANEF